MDCGKIAEGLSNDQYWEMKSFLNSVKFDELDPHGKEIFINTRQIVEAYERMVT